MNLNTYQEYTREQDYFVHQKSQIDQIRNSPAKEIQQMEENGCWINMSGEPLVQLQVTAYVDMLSKINIKQKKYQQLLKEYEDEKKKMEIANRLDKIKTEAQEALKKSKGKRMVAPKNKWGHSLFAIKSEPNDKQEIKQQFQSIKQQSEKIQDHNKKIALKPINQRIAEYKQRQARKHKQNDNANLCCAKQPNQKEIQEQNKIIKANAERILDQMRKQKEEKQEEKKIIQAKIRALQIKALKKVEICKKKPLEAGGDFDFGGSQYSTFSARANNRKIVPKNKKGKQQVQDDPSLMVTKKTNLSKKYGNNLQNGLSKRNSEKQQLAKTLSMKMMEEQKKIEQKQKGPFYLWNIPISPEDQQKLKHTQKEVFFNVDRFNYKSGKTFREEANEYLAQKMMRQLESSKVQMKEQAFLREVQKKKEILNKQFRQEQGQKYLNEPIWSEDQLFKPSVLQNFHFYTKNAPY